MPIEGVIQRSPDPRTPADRPEVRPKGGGQKASPSGKPQGTISILHARRDEIESKLQALRNGKQWRAGFHAFIKDSLALLDEQFKKYDELEKEMQAIEDEWYVFEYEPKKYTWAKLNQLWKKIATAYWDLQHTSEAEEKYEAEALKVEQGLVKEQESIDSDIRAIDRGGKALTESQYEPLAARLDRLSVDIGKLSDGELKAQVRFTGSGPVSRPE